MTTPSSRILVADSASARLLVRDSQFLIDKPLAVLVDLRERQAFRARLASLADGAVLRDWVLRLNAPGGRSLHVVARVEAKMSRSGTSELRWSIRRARGPLAAAADRAEEGAEDLDRLLAELTHELNQPLAAIISFARGCVLRSRDRRLRKEDLESTLESIVGEAHRAAGLLRTAGRRRRVAP